MKRIAFTIPADPVPQGRPRVTTSGGFAHVYQPTATIKWQQQVRLFCVQAMAQVDGETIPGPVGMVIEFYLPRPGRLIHKQRPMPACSADRKPDLDNLVKAILDGVNGVAFGDDRQVVEITARKFYAAGPGYGDTRPRVEVTIEELTEEGVQHGRSGRNDGRSAATSTQGALL